jgi:hypothetical protein
MAAKKTGKATETRKVQAHKIAAQRSRSTQPKVAQRPERSLAPSAATGYTEHAERSPKQPPDLLSQRTAMPTLLFYQKPIALNREAHRNLKVRSVPSFAYAAKTNSVPLTGNEFAAAARQIPILFVADASQQFSPIALLGVRHNENLFVEADGRWSCHYVPAFVRRYPFVLIETGKPEELAVGIDEAYAGFNTEDGEPIFSEDGNDGAALKRAIEFLNAYKNEAARTRAFLTELKRLKLLVPRVLNIALKDGPQFKLDGFSVIDEALLAKLDDKEAGNLLRNGYLGWIYMHLLSMSNVPDLAVRLEPRLKN